MSLLDYEKRFSSLKMNTRGGQEKSPHKVALLLAVLDLIEAKHIKDNQIYFDDRLRDVFTQRFETLASSQDRDNPHLPFFHLRSSGFWHHKVKYGRDRAYDDLTTASGPGAITSNIEYAYFDDELFELLGNDVARELLKSALARNLNEQDVTQILDVGSGWNWLECEAIVSDYFVMLDKEVRGEAFNKTRHREALMPKLADRSGGSIEFKHRNISAILVEIGQPYIQGYRPAYNYQQQLREVVLAHLAGHLREFEDVVQAVESDGPGEDVVVDWESVLDQDIPERLATIREPERRYLARITNFAERERLNRRLGERGEEFVLEFERFRMRQAQRPDLVDEIEWCSKTQGDGLGYDIRSFDPIMDREQFIEVKTTNNGKYQPFFISANEVDFSQGRADQYQLYRVFNFRAAPRIFQLPGAIERHVHLTAQNFKASFS